MDKDQYIALAGKIADGTASEEEIAMYNAYYNAYQLKYPSWGQLDMAQRKAMVAEAEDGIHSQLQVSAGKKALKLWPRVAVAAAAVAAITLGVWLYYASSINGRHSDAGQNPGLAMNDIAPGKNTAMLTLANGKVINLDTNRTSVVVTDSVKTTMMLTASTPRGGTYQVVLPDGTRVWLNADSKISFPSQFTGKERKILLLGEAYFEVTKNKEKPFIVESNGQEVTVLGTHFNINSYADEGNTKTTLLEGSVNVNGTILKPGQQSVVSGSNRIAVNEIDAETAVAWKNGEFVFESESIESIMRRIARWYDVEIIYEGDVKHKEIWGSVSKYEQVSKVLKILAGAQTVDFEISNKTIIVKPFKSK